MPEHNANFGGSFEDDVAMYESRIKAARAVAEQAKVTKSNKAVSVFDDANDIGVVINYAVGAASVCWSDKPTGIFDSDMALAISQAAADRIELLVKARAKKEFDKLLGEYAASVNSKFQAIAGQIAEREAKQP